MNKPIDYNKSKLYEVTTIFCVTYLIFSIIGAIYYLHINLIVSLMMKYTTLGLGGLNTRDIFINNAFAVMLLMGYFTFITTKIRGVFGCIYPIYIGSIVGFVSGAMINKGALIIVFEILPHGIIELTVMLLSIAVGWKISEITDWKDRIIPYSKSVLIFCGLLLISAFIEVNVSAKI